MTLIATTREDLRAELIDILRRELLVSIIESVTHNPEKLYTRAETARKLGKSKNTIQRMIDDNRLTATTDGKYISQQSIDNYLNNTK